MRTPIHAFLGVYLAVCVAHLGGQTPPTDSEQIDKLVAQLGDAKFRTREQATAALVKMPTARLALAKAVKSADPELAKRAQTALNACKRETLPHQSERMKVAAKNGEADIVAALMLQYDWPNDDNRPWQAYLDCLWTILDRDKSIVETLQERHLPPRTVEKYITTHQPLRYSSLESISIDPERENGGPPYKTALVRASRLKSKSPLDKSLLAINNCDDLSCSGSIAIANDSSTFWGTPSVLICDGDVTFDNASRSHIIASGNIWVRTYCSRSSVWAGGEVDLFDPLNIPVTVAGSTLRAGGAVNPRNTRLFENKNTFEPQHKNPLGVVRFFDLKRVGIDAASKVDAGVRIDKVDGKSKLALAGLQAGDVVITVDDTRVFTPDALRRALRTAFVNEYGFVTVERAGKGVTLEVQF